MRNTVPVFEGHDDPDACDPRRFPVSMLLPQSGVMRLVDRLVAVSALRAVTALTVRGDPAFARAGRVPAWVGLEYMAQTIAAWSGYHCLRRGAPIRAGLLLGTRSYEAAVDHFVAGRELRVGVGLVFRGANDMSVFDCEIRTGGRALARARLNVLLPRDLRAYLQGKIES